MQGTHADFGDGGGAEGFAEAVDGFVKEDGDGFRGVVAAIEAGAAGDEYDLDVGIGYPGGDLRADVVFVVGEQGARGEVVSGGAHGVFEVLAGGVFRERPRVGDGEDGDVQRIEGFGGFVAHGVFRWGVGRWCTAHGSEVALPRQFAAQLANFFLCLACFFGEWGFVMFFHG